MGNKGSSETVEEVGEEEIKKVRKETNTQEIINGKKMGLSQLIQTRASASNGKFCKGLVPRCLIIMSWTVAQIDVFATPFI